jgi:hypothetical protein
MEATSNAVIDLPALNGNFTKMQVVVNGDTAWAPIDGHEGDWGGYHPMTASYVDNVFTNGRPMVTIGQSVDATNPQADDLTVEPVQPGAVLYRVDGGAWHEFKGQDFTLAQGTDFDLAYNERVDGYTAPGTENSGHYDITVVRTK